MPNLYQLMIETKDGLVPMSWSPRPYKSVAALFHYYSRTWPMNAYWIREVS